MSRPFDEARYKGLLEGLDISVLKLSEVREGNRVFRYDTQYFSKAALTAEARVKKGNWATLEKLTNRIESFGAYALTNEFAYVEKGIPFLRCVNIRNGFANFSDVLFIDSKANDLLSKSEVKPGMLLLTMSGSVGNAAVALESWNYPINSNQDIAKITPAREISPFFLAAFIGSRYGQIQMERLPVGSVQQHIFLWMIEQIAVARFSPAFESAISKAVDTAYAAETQFRIYQEQAEQTLLHALNLINWQPPEPLTYACTSSGVFAAERLDADYFSPKYEAMIARMKACGECVSLGSLLKVNQRGKQPIYSEIGLPVVNSKHVLKNEVRLNESNAYAIVVDGAMKIENGDVLINGTGVGTIGRAAAYLHDTTALPDNHVTILRPHAGAIDPIYLSVYLNTIAGQWQVEKYLRGSSGQIEVYPVDIAQFKICLAPQALQQEIRGLILSAFAARSKANSLLDIAKQSVEVAIEQGEEAAMKLLSRSMEP